MRGARAELRFAPVLSGRVKEVKREIFLLAYIETGLSSAPEGVPGADMSDQGAATEAGKAIGDPLGTIVGWLAGLLPEGPGRTLLYVLVGLCAAVAPFSYKYYLGLVGGAGRVNRAAGL